MIHRSVAYSSRKAKSLARQSIREAVPHSIMANIQYTFTDINVRPVDDPIWFDPIGLKTIITSHKDALVLMLTIGGHLVSRVLIGVLQIFYTSLLSYKWVTKLTSCILTDRC